MPSDLVKTLRVHRRLGLEAAVAVWSALPIAWGHVLDLLAQLVEQSLVVLDSCGSEPRYRLVEIICQYGLNKLLIANELERDWISQLASFIKVFAPCVRNQWPLVDKLSTYLARSGTEPAGSLVENGAINIPNAIVALSHPVASVLATL